jgi:HAD superfamily hydrolase (TIGR01509 family)
VRRALLFDLDGTIVETNHLHYLTWRDALAPRGVALDEAGFRTHISGRLNPDIVRDLLPDLPLGAALAVADEKEAAFRALASSLAPLPGLVALLGRARAAGAALAVVTNAPAPNAEAVLEVLGLRASFEHLVLAERVGRGKPEPDAYLEALRLTGVAAREALAFEDSPAGVVAAVAAGIEVVGLATGHDPAGLEAAGAGLIVEDFTDPRVLEAAGL